MKFDFVFVFAAFCVCLSESISLDEIYMQKAIELARKGFGKTSPNPNVGCVIVSKDGELIGEGYHKCAGFPHAEVEAINSCKNSLDKLKDATAYVTLEPCNHFGKTPPCTEALIKHGISRVVVGMVDPDSRVSGKGIQKLRTSGVEVSVGVKEKDVIELNNPFIFRVLTNRSYVVCLTKLGHLSCFDFQNMWNSSLSEINGVCVLVNKDERKENINWEELQAIPQHVSIFFIVSGDFVENGEFVKNKDSEKMNSFQTFSSTDMNLAVEEFVKSREKNTRFFINNLPIKECLSNFFQTTSSQTSCNSLLLKDFHVDSIENKKEEKEIFRWLSARGMVQKLIIVDCLNDGENNKKEEFAKDISESRVEEIARGIDALYNDEKQENSLLFSSIPFENNGKTKVFMHKLWNYKVKN